MDDEKGVYKSLSGRTDPLVREREDIYTALTKAQEEFKALTKNAKGYNYQYADLAHIMDHTLPILSKHGINVHFPIEIIKDYAMQDEPKSRCRYHTLSCVLTHNRCGQIRSQVEIHLDHAGGGSKMLPIQSFGSTLTYLKRYLYLGMIGLAVKGEDDDGKSSTWGQKRKPEVANV